MIMTDIYNGIYAFTIFVGLLAGIGITGGGTWILYSPDAPRPRIMAAIAVLAIALGVAMWTGTVVEAELAQREQRVEAVVS